MGRPRKVNWTMESVVSKLHEIAVNGKMPTQAELKENGLNTINRFIAANGGVRAIADGAGLVYFNRGRTKWTNELAIDELRKMAVDGVMPTYNTLEVSNNSLMSFIVRNGGIPHFSELAGLDCDRTWIRAGDLDDEIVVAKLIELSKECDGFYPSKEKLTEPGNNAYLRHINANGGRDRFLELTGLPPMPAFNDLVFTEEEIIRRLQSYAVNGVFPSHKVLEEAGEITLISKIGSTGGKAHWAPKAGLSPNRRPKAKKRVWTTEEAVAELKKHGEDGYMPTSTSLQKAGLASLNQFINANGGVCEFAQAHGFKLTTKQLARLKVNKPVSKGKVSFQVPIIEGVPKLRVTSFISMVMKGEINLPSKQAQPLA